MKKIPSVLAVLFFVLPFWSAQAASIGLSPSELITEVKIGEKSEQMFMVSRSDSVGETRFDVSAEEGADYLDLAGQQEFVIPDGENLAPFVFYIDATNLPLGEHKTLVRLIMQDEINPYAAGNKIKFGLTGKIKFVVVNELSPAAVLPVVEEENFWKKSAVPLLAGFFAAAVLVCFVVFRGRFVTFTRRFLSLTRKCVRAKLRRNAANQNSRRDCRRAKSTDSS